MSLARLAYVTSRELEIHAKAEADARRKATAERISDRMLRIARAFKAFPGREFITEEWEAWCAKAFPSGTRVAPEPSADALAAEVAALRAELARRDADEAWKGTET